jgi:hypothetical protein
VDKIRSGRILENETKKKKKLTRHIFDVRVAYDYDAFCTINDKKYDAL